MRIWPDEVDDKARDMMDRARAVYLKEIDYGSRGHIVVFPSQIEYEKGFEVEKKVAIGKIRKCNHAIIYLGNIGDGPLFSAVSRSTLIKLIKEQKDVKYRVYEGC